jgi:two-component system, chemotaxis family, chemotaxis protein CheY
MATVLIIDDDPLMRLTIKRILLSAEHEVLEACDGREGLEVFRARRPDLVITDIIMPNVEGIETIRELKRIAPATRIVAISGGGRVSNTDFLVIAKKLGADIVMAKPLRAAELLAAVGRLLAETPAPSEAAPQRAGT